MSSDISHRIPLTGEGRSLGGKISGGRGRPWGIFFGFYKTRHFAIQQCKLHRATCRHFDTIPACDGQTDGRTADGIAIANTALATRALRRSVKKEERKKKGRQKPQGKNIMYASTTQGGHNKIKCRIAWGRWAWRVRTLVRLDV